MRLSVWNEMVLNALLKQSTSGGRKWSYSENINTADSICVKRCDSSMSHVVL